MKEKQVKQAILDYLLTKNTSYALMISGKWGCGKTYHWKNVLSPEIIEKTKNLNTSDKNKNYRSIYISLYGIENIEEISKRLFLELIPKSGKSKAAGIIKTVGSKMISSASSFFNLGDLNLDINDIKSIYDLSSCVITFDDLERISGDNELLDKILGFINYLSEHDSIKVILLTNENELIAKFEDKWTKTKEKIVNQTIPFSVNYEAIIESIIESFKQFKSYHKFLVENKSIIQKAFNLSETTNLRTLKYSLERFLKLFGLFENNNETEFIRDYGKNLLYYTMIISFEHKKGFIDKDDKFEISSLSPHSMSEKQMTESILRLSSPSNSISEPEKSEEEEYRSNFIDRYYKDGEQIINLKILFDFIITGLYDQNLIRSLKENYIPKDTDEAPQLAVLNPIHSYVLNGMSQKELITSIDQVLSYAVNGEYHIMYYPIIYDLFQRMNLDKVYQTIPLKRIKYILLKGINTAYKNEINRKHVPFAEDHWGEPPTKDYDIRIRFKELWKQNKEYCDKLKAKAFLEKLEDQPMEAIDLIYKYNGHTDINPIFKYLPITRLTKTIFNLDNKALIELNHRLKERFNYASNEMLTNEKDSLIKLLSKLKLYVKKRKTYDLKVFHIEYLIRNLTNITR